MLLFFIVLFQVGVVMKGNYKLTYCKFLLLYYQNAPLNFLNRQIFWKNDCFFRFHIILWV